MKYKILIMVIILSLSSIIVLGTDNLPEYDASSNKLFEDHFDGTTWNATGWWGNIGVIPIQNGNISLNGTGVAGWNDKLVYITKQNFSTIGNLYVAVKYRYGGGPNHRTMIVMMNATDKGRDSYGDDSHVSFDFDMYDGVVGSIQIYESGTIKATTGFAMNPDLEYWYLFNFSEGGPLNYYARRSTSGTPWTLIHTSTNHFSEEVNLLFNVGAGPSTAVYFDDVQVWSDASVDLLLPNATIYYPNTTDYIFNDSIKFNMSCVDETNLKNLTVSIYNYSGVVYQDNVLNIGMKTYNYTNLTDISGINDGNYSVKLICYDTSGNSESKNVSIIIDKTIPLAVYNYPLDDNSSSIQVNSSLVFDWVFTDSNQLWSVNISCDDYNFSVNNIGSSVYNFNQSNIFSNVGTQVCDINYCDSHTALSINDYTVEKDYEHNTLKFNGIEIQSKTTLIQEMTYTKEKDKYSFCFLPFEYKDQLVLTLSDECISVSNSKYKNHFVCDNKYWIDFEGQKAYSIYNNVYIDTKSYIDDKFNIPVCFESIGSLNCGSDSLSFNVTAIPIPPVLGEYEALSNNTPLSWTIPIDTDSTQGILLLFLYLAICLGITILGIFIGSGEIVALSGFIWLFFGFIIAMNISIIFGLLIIVIGMMFLLLGAMSLR